MKQSCSNLRFKGLVLPFLVLFFFFGLWEIGVRVLKTSKDTFPPPSKCFFALTNPKLYEVSDSRFNDKPAVMALFHFSSSIGRVALALLAVAVLAIPCAVLLEGSVHFRLGFAPLFSSLASVTPMVWMLLAIRMPFLNGEYAMPAFVIMGASVFLMAISVSQQFASVPRSQRDLGLRLGATRRKFWWRIIFPSSAPQLLHLFRVQFLFSLAIVPFVELTGVQYGVGQLVHTAKQGSNISLALGLIILLAATGFGVDFLFRNLQKQLFKWQVFAPGNVQQQ